jgi:hypothetical protein
MWIALSLALALSLPTSQPASQPAEPCSMHPPPCKPTDNFCLKCVVFSLVLQNRILQDNIADVREQLHLADANGKLYEEAYGQAQADAQSFTDQVKIGAPPWYLHPAAMFTFGGLSVGLLGLGAVEAVLAVQKQQHKPSQAR